MKYSNTDNIRSYIIEIPFDLESKTIKEGMERIREIMAISGFKTVSIHHVPNKRTSKQNRALHLWFTQLADALNGAGYDMKKTIRAEVDIPWTAGTVKENLWRPIQQAYLQKKSTTKLDTLDIDRIYDVINRMIGERTGVHVPFPSLDALMDQDLTS